MRVHGYEVRGVELDGETRCAHYGTERDVVVIKFDCCGAYYACYRCHKEGTDHERSRWPLERRDEKAVLCGVCGTELAVQEYLGVDDILLGVERRGFLSLSVAGPQTRRQDSLAVLQFVCCSSVP